MDKRKTFFLYCDLLKKLSGLPDAVLGQVFFAVLQYVNGCLQDEEDIGSDLAALAFAFIKADIDRANELHEEIAAGRAEAGRKGAAKRWQTMANDGKAIAKDSKAKQTMTTDSEKEKEKEKEYISPKGDKRFTPPSVEDVNAFCREQGCKIDAVRFVNYYTSNGWMVGRTKMKDWRAAARGWAARDKKPGTAYHSQNDDGQDLDALLRGSVV